MAVPSRNPRRRNARPDWRKLPPEGRPGPPPPWPLERPTAGVLRIWDYLWTKPQAVAWEDLGHERTVARYARQLYRAERPEPTAALLAEVRQLEDRLGLNPLAMRRLMWEMAEAPAQEPPADVASMDDYRSRLG
jgi:hypothetical protein